MDSKYLFRTAVISNAFLQAVFWVDLADWMADYEKCFCFNLFASCFADRE